MELRSRACLGSPSLPSDLADRSCRRHGRQRGEGAGRTGHPLAINYAQWLKFASAVTGAVRTQTESPDLGSRSMANRLVLDTGWARIELELS
jgi:hypothetical protein